MARSDGARIPSYSQWANGLCPVVSIFGRNRQSALTPIGIIQFAPCSPVCVPEVGSIRNSTKAGVPNRDARWSGVQSDSSFRSCHSGFAWRSAIASSTRPDLIRSWISAGSTRDAGNVIATMLDIRIFRQTSYIHTKRNTENSVRGCVIFIPSVGKLLALGAP